MLRDAPRCEAEHAASTATFFFGTDIATGVLGPPFDGDFSLGGTASRWGRHGVCLAVQVLSAAKLKVLARHELGALDCLTNLTNLATLISVCTS